MRTARARRGAAPPMPPPSRNAPIRCSRVRLSACIRNSPSSSSVAGRKRIEKMPDSRREKPSIPPRRRQAHRSSAERSFESNRGLWWRERLLLEIEAIGHVVGGLVACVDRRQTEGLLAELDQAHVGVLG